MYERIEDTDLLEEIMFGGGGDEYTEIAEIITGKSRWHVQMETVFRRNSDNKLFIMDWGRGATEGQDHIVPEEAVEAEEYTVSVVKYRARK